MGYVENTLIKGEKIIYQTKLHWIIFLKSILWFITAIIAFILINNLSDKNIVPKLNQFFSDAQNVLALASGLFLFFAIIKKSLFWGILSVTAFIVLLGTPNNAILFKENKFLHNNHDVAVFVAGLCFLISILKSIRPFIAFISSEFAVTNKRVIIKVGLIRRASLELLLKKVESIAVFQSILGRIFGFGRLVVKGTGGTRNSFYGVKNPIEFRKQVQTQVELVQNSK